MTVVRGGRVFISHSADDAAVASEVCAAIEKRGIACWIAPRDIRAGDDFLESIQSAIESATAFVLVLSRSSTQSPFVLSETEVAFSYKRPIFPLRIEKVDPGGSLKMLLSRWHRVDAIGPGREAGLKRLADAVARRVSGGAGAREAPRPAAAAVAPVVPTRWSAFLGGPLWLLATGATGAAIALSCALLALALVGAGLGSGASGAALWLLLGWIAAGAATALLARPAKVPAGNGPAIAGALVASALLAFVLLGFTRQGEGIDVAANANPALNVVDAAAAPPPAARLDQEAIAAEENQRLHDLANDAANNAAPPAAVNAVANVLIDLTTMTSANSTSTELPPVNGM